MNRYLARAASILAVSLVVVPLMGAVTARAETDASWAWPGMRFDIYAAGSWSSCSVGYPAWENGIRYFITAGHCFRDDDGGHYLHTDGTALDIYSPSDHRTPIGFEETYPRGKEGWYTDISLVQMYPGRELHGQGWEHIPDDPVVADVGDGACLAGYRHDTSNCGRVTKTGSEITITGFPWSTIVTETNYCSHPGDSGGAVYNRKLGGALGINITGDRKHNEPGTPGDCNSTYIPMGRVLRFLRQFHPSLSI